MITDHMRLCGSVEVRVFDVGSVMANHPRYESMSREERHRAVESTQAMRGHEGHNVILDGWLETFAASMVQDADIGPLQPNEFAVGDDDTAEASSDTELGNEVFRGPVDTSEEVSGDYTASGFLDSGEGNGHTLREVGLVADGTHVNRSTDFTEEEKTSGIIVTFNFTIEINP